MGGECSRELPLFSIVRVPLFYLPDGNKYFDCSKGKKKNSVKTFTFSGSCNSLGNVKYETKFMVFKDSKP
jgi:hypothetical protein